MCPWGYYLINGTCMSNCPTGFYSNPDYTCTRCVSPCLQCINI